MHTTPMRPSIVIAALVLAACGQPSSDSKSSVPNCATRSSDAIGGPFSLLSHEGARLTEADFKGRKTLVYFGFTHCPDVCPTTLFRAGAALAQLPDGAEAPRTALFTVDPERDTPEALAQYIGSNGFPADIVGLTGSPAEMQAVSRRFAAGDLQKQDVGSSAGYVVAHADILYLMDEDWRLQTFFTPDQRAEDIARCIASLG
jgi:protein SCO1